MHSVLLKTLTTSSAVFVALMATSTAEALVATQTVEKEVVQNNDDGSVTTKRLSAASITPGERVVYTLRYTNDDAKEASNLVMTMPVPQQVMYIDGSASRVGATAQYSVDGGTSFAERGALAITGTDGSIRSAQATDITHVRWTVEGPVAPQEVGKLEFKGILK